MTVQVKNGKIEVTVEPVQYELSLARTGPQGARGPKGDTGSSFINATAAQTISGHIAVRYNSSGQILPASANVSTDINSVVGVTTGAITINQSGNIQNSGLLEHNGWTFTPNSPIYLGNNGALTQSLPIDAEFILVLGIAISATKITINIQPAIQLAN